MFFNIWIIEGSKYLVAVFAIPCCVLLLYSVKANHAFGLAPDQLIRKPYSQVGFSEQGQLAQGFSLEYFRISISNSIDRNN